jgi:hypothetical protein
VLDFILKSDNPLIRYGGATLIVFGGLYCLGAIGLFPTKSMWLIAVIILLWLVLTRKDLRIAL